MDRSQITSNSKWSPDSPRLEWEGGKPVYQFRLPGSIVTNDSSLIAKLYQGSTTPPTGLSQPAIQTSTTEPVITVGPIIGMLGGNTYVLEIWATLDGVLDMWVAIEIQVLKPGGR